MEKKRLDVYLVENKIFETRQKAQSAIEQKQIYIDGKCIDKVSYKVDENLDISKIEIRGEILKYVSRGGLKLEKAINVFSIDVNEFVCIDIGSSTGGFTDCLLQNGAKYVYAVDVGTDQLHTKLREDERVKCMEKTNFKDLDKSSLDREIDFFCTDVSFISLEKILPNAYNILKENGSGVCLIKPQFELTKSDLNKKGVVKDKKAHKRAIQKVIECAENLGFVICGLDYSPIKGPEGNIEFLLYIKKKDTDEKIYKYNIEQIVAEAHAL